MSILEVHDVSIRYITGDFKDIGLKEYAMKKIAGEYKINEFWADRNISFTLEKGEMLGIIGTNGAGKSTLLKAVSGIMEPTEGYVMREGNIAALLELASGFDGDLTVKENTYLRGAMLGYTREFMDEAYDQIIDFADLQDFQDRPFRQLSSGMKSRLAFSIASLIQPDILILDEVLSVGDGAFRKKSEEKMKEIIAGGAATILVSHSIDQVRSLCTKVLWLDRGEQIVFSDDVEGICNLYQQFLDKGITLDRVKRKLNSVYREEKGEEKTEESVQVIYQADHKDMFEIDKINDNCLMKKPECSYILLQGIFLISVLFFALFISSILLIFHITISSINLLLAALCGTAVTFYFSGGSIKKTVITTAVGLLIIAAGILLCMHIYDGSWDGNAHRKLRTGLLKYGWNPICETLSEFAAEYVPDVNVDRIAYDVPPYASEIIAANFYAVTNNIESGKCYTILAALSLTFICYAFLRETIRLKKWQSACCSLFAAFNPVVLSQCVTNYNDAFLGIILLLCAVSLLYLTFYERKKYDLLSWYLVFVSINIGFNLKLNMVLFLAILCLTLFVYWVFAKTTKEGFCKAILYYRKHICIFAVSVLSGFLVTGSTCYVRNIFIYGHPFGNSVADYAQGDLPLQFPVAYRELSNIKQFIYSLFSKVSNNKALDIIELKIPLMFDSTEIASIEHADTRIGGWGIFFSGIFLISVFIILFYLLKKESIPLKLKCVTAILILIFCISLFCIPALLWARYNMAPFWFPVAALIFIFMDTNKSKDSGHGMLIWAGFLMALLYINMIPNIMKDKRLFKEYVSTYEQLEQFKGITENNNVVINVVNGNFYGRFFNLYDMGITNFTRGDVDLNNHTGNLFGSWGLIYNVIGVLPIDSLSSTIDYLDRNKENFIILLAVKDEASNALTQEVVQMIQTLGLEFDLQDHYRWSYLAIVDAGNVLYEDLSDSKLEYRTEIAGKKIEIQSAGFQTGNAASIKINDVECALNRRGLNIVVYDKAENRVVDSVCIDTYSDNILSR